MLDALVFGATGFTGRLVATALARRGARFALAGRNRARLEAVAHETGADEVAVAAVGKVDALAEAAARARVLVTCVGPFAELGETAVRAALQAGTHYVDSTGEAPFVARLLERFDEPARAGGITLAPALAFDEVPADVAATIATAGMEGAELTLTYAVPSHATRATLRSSIGILTWEGSWLRDGSRVPVRTGELGRWAPLPPPLGPRPSLSAHMAEGWLAPLHLDVASVGTYLATSTARRAALRLTLPLLKAAAARPPVRGLVETALGAFLSHPGDHRARNKRWTVLAEARRSGIARSVAITGSDTYGLSADLLAAGAVRLAHDPPPGGGVRAPVQAVDLSVWKDELADRGASILVFEPR